MKLRLSLLLLMLLPLSGVSLWANTAIKTPLRVEALDAQLEILLPGTSIQANSARVYARRRLLTVIDELEAQKVAKKNPAKAISLIKDVVEKTLLTQYEAFAELTSLFTQGTYDQTSATIVYALIMDNLVIPYRLQVRETEVALIVYPDSEARLLKIVHSPGFSETSSKRFKAAYLEFLTATGTIPPNSWNRSPDVLFLHYYPGQEEPVDMTTIASFLCYRQALKAYNENAWMVTLDRLDCARQLDPSPAYGVLEKAVWLQLANLESSGRESLYYLWQLWEQKPENAWQTELVNRFNKAITSLPEASVWVIDSLYLSFHNNFENHPEAQAQLKEMYFLQRARFHAQEGKYFPVMNFMDSLFQLRPNDTEVHHVIGFMLVKTLRPIREYQEGLERISYYQKRYPFLNRNLLFQDRNLYYQAERIHDLFAIDKPEEGIRYFNEFVVYSKQSHQTKGYASWVTTAYLAASNYYFREKDYLRAFQLIEQALQEIPTDDYLLHRRDLLRRYLR